MRVDKTFTNLREKIQKIYFVYFVIEAITHKQNISDMSIKNQAGFDTANK